MKPRTHNPKPSQTGFALVLTVLFISILTSICLVLSAIFTPKIRASSEISKSSAALYAAESGLEWCLHVNRKSPPQPTPPLPVMANSATYINGITNLPFNPADCLAATIKAIGTYQGISRSFEISF